MGGRIYPPHHHPRNHLAAAVRYAEKEKALREARRPPDGDAPRLRSRKQRAKTAVRYAQRWALSKATKVACEACEAVGWLGIVGW